MPKDIKAQPYAQWLEGILSELVEMEPVSICIVFTDSEGQTGTAYFNTDNNDRAQMIRTIAEDSLLNFMSVNKKYISDLLDEEGDGGEEAEESDE